MGRIELICSGKWIIGVGALAVLCACSTNKNQYPLSARDGPPIECSISYTTRVVRINETWQLNDETGLRVVSLSTDATRCELALVVGGKIIKTGWYREGDFVDLDEKLLGTHGFQVRSVKLDGVEVRQTHA